MAIKDEPGAVTNPPSIKCEHGGQPSVRFEEASPLSIKLEEDIPASTECKLESDVSETLTLPVLDDKSKVFKTDASDPPSLPRPPPTQRPRPHLTPSEAWAIWEKKNGERLRLRRAILNERGERSSPHHISSGQPFPVEPLPEEVLREWIQHGDEGNWWWEFPKDHPYMDLINARFEPEGTVKRPAGFVVKPKSTPARQKRRSSPGSEKRRSERKGRGSRRVADQAPM